MNDGLNPTPKPASKSGIYFILGWILLLVMALTWSLDDSFVYISLGGAVFFFFLALYNRPSQTSHKRSDQYSSKQYQSSGKDFVTAILDLLKSKNGPSSGSRSRKQRSQPIDKGKIMAMFVMFFIASFFLIIFVSLFFADGAEEFAEVNEHFQKAEEARYAGDFDSAEYYYRKALEDDPQNLSALNGLGIVSLNRERYDQAVSQFDDALRADPDYEYARYNKALAFYYQRNYRRSLSETFDLLRRSPDYFDAMQLAGDNYYEQQRYDSAKYWYDQGYNSGVRNVWICHLLGYLYDRDNDLQRAIELYREALSYDSSRVEIYERMAELHPGEEGDFFRAKAAQWKQE